MSHTFRTCRYRLNDAKKKTILEAHKFRCTVCQGPLNMRVRDWDIDHAVSPACGVTFGWACSRANDVANLRPVHIMCHHQRHANDKRSAREVPKLAAVAS